MEDNVSVLLKEDKMLEKEGKKEVMTQTPRVSVEENKFHSQIQDLFSMQNDDGFLRG